MLRLKLMFSFYVFKIILNAYVQTVTGLLCGAVQFELQELENVCWDFIENCLTTGRAESLLVPTRAYSQHEITRQVFDKVISLFDVVLKADVKAVHPMKVHGVTKTCLYAIYIFFYFFFQL